MEFALSFGDPRFHGVGLKFLYKLSSDACERNRRTVGRCALMLECLCEIE
jgi:hypothetical protein